MMVGGLEPVSSGRIIVDGAPMTGPRTSIGVMFQDPTLLPWKSALDNVLFPVRVLKRSIEDYREAAHDLLQQVGLNGFEHKRPHELSGGMRQRVAICRTLVYDPDVLLMDEPFSALDAISRDEMNELLLDLWQQFTKTALFVTHSIREAVMLADRVLVMTRRPATIVEDLAVPFARPRSMALGENREFNEICGHLRERIEESHDRPRALRAGTNCMAARGGNVSVEVPASRAARQRPSHRPEPAPSRVRSSCRLPRRQRRCCYGSSPRSGCTYRR